MKSETLWLTQYQLEELFDTDRTSLTRHIKNIIDSGELEKEATCANFAQVRQEGARQVNRNIRYYNLDMILSVGYRDIPETPSPSSHSNKPASDNR